MGSSLRERAGRIPDAAWLTGIVVLSVLGRLWLVHEMPGPYIFVDELIYSELAKSLADTGSFAIRGVPVHGYSILYPALMALVVPSMAYTATIVTENLFYPVALLFAWVLVLALERPSLLRVGLLGVVLVTAIATRSQALGFVGAAVLAPFVLALLRWDARVLRPFLSRISSARTAWWAKAATTSVRCCGSGSGMWRSSRSTSASSPSSPSSCCSSRPGGWRRRSRRISRRRSRWW